MFEGPEIAKVLARLSCNEGGRAGAGESWLAGLLQHAGFPVLTRKLALWWS